MVRQGRPSQSREQGDISEPGTQGRGWMQARHVHHWRFHHRRAVHKDLMTQPRSSRPVSSRILALIVSAALFMELMDGTILATALPQMAQSFDVAPLQMSVALTAYLLSLAVFIPASGWMADRFGSRRIFMGAIALFVTGSMVCGMANALPEMVIARLVQGAGGAMMVPVGRLLLLRNVPRHELVSAIAWMTIPATLGPILGPPVGGFLTTWLSWRWIFYINLPIGLLGMGLAARFVPNVTETELRPLDVKGVLLSGTALASLLWAMETLGRGPSGTDGTALSSAAILTLIGLGSGWLYLRHSRTIPHPILNPMLMRIRTFRLSVLGGACSRVVAGAMPFLLPMTMQLGMGMSAAESGSLTFVGAAGSLLIRPWAAGILRRFGFRCVMIWNGALSSTAVLLCATFQPSWPHGWFFLVLAPAGLFQALQFIAYNTIAYADVPRERMSEATSFYTTFQQMTLSAGICIAGISVSLSMLAGPRTQPDMTDFATGFVTIATISALAILCASRLNSTDGQDLSRKA
ncbi:Multidrug resistance protein B [Granulibacter bethesdensis CGDNIH4]|nr:Multidrug resistance protein B [Granulibacter bethesdensis CGDNIH4]